jgi:hypothetical protein
MKTGTSSKRAPRKLFTAADDARLRALVALHGTGAWGKIAQEMQDRNRRRCSERWSLYLAPDLTFSPWSCDEDSRLLAMVAEHGTRWKFLESFFPGRKDNALKNRHKRLLRHKVQTNQDANEPQNDSSEGQSDSSLGPDSCIVLSDSVEPWEQNDE